jgi:mannose-6-phosphate isomerase-like protein (cupin superfamily)
MARIVVCAAPEKFMLKVPPAAFLIAVLLTSPAGAQRRGAAPAPTTGAVSFAVTVQDSTGAPIPQVNVTLTGPVSRTARTEGGRIAFESLPAGPYKFRFDKEGFVPLERELSARGATPIDVKVTLTAMPPPPAPPPAPVPEPTPTAGRTVNAKPVAIDMPAFIEKYYVGRAAGKTTAITCATGGDANLLQLNDGLAEHTHADADEFLYVIAGQGAVRMGEKVEALGPGVFMMIPRGTAHVITPAVKKPLVALSLKAGEKCGG